MQYYYKGKDAVGENKKEGKVVYLVEVNFNEENKLLKILNGIEHRVKHEFFGTLEEHEKDRANDSYPFVI